jgi:hypothetical protein
MPETNRLTKSQNPQPKPLEQISVKEKDGLLAETVYIEGHATPVQFAIKKLGGITIEPCLKTDTRQVVPPSTTALMAKPGVVLLPSAATAYGSQEDLVTDIKDFIHRYADVSPFREDLTAHFLMMTWLYDLFTAVPYLRFLGEPGTGKSRMLQVAGHLAYKGIFAGGATTSSPLFRLIEVYRGTLVIDEADYKASDAWIDIIKILNAGYMKGVPVLRSEKVGDTYEPRPYNVYGPKIIGNRFPFDDWALESRCITLEMESGPTQRLQLNGPQNESVVGWDPPSESSSSFHRICDNSSPSFGRVKNESFRKEDIVVGGFESCQKLADDKELHTAVRMNYQGCPIQRHKSAPPNLGRRIIQRDKLSERLHLCLLIMRFPIKQDIKLRIRGHEKHFLSYCFLIDIEVKKFLPTRQRRSFPNEFDAIK